MPTDIRFPDTRWIEVRFGCSCAGCKRVIRKGERAGYGRKGRTSYTWCSDCYGKWVCENREDDLREQAFREEERYR